MSSLDPLELKVDSGDVAIESESVIVNGAPQRRPLVALCVVVLLGFIGWQLFGAGEGSESSDSADLAAADVTAEIEDPEVPDTGTETPTPPTVSLAPDDPEYSVVEERLEIEGDETAIGGVSDGSDTNAEPVSGPTFPLFPERPGLTIAFPRSNGEVVLLNADDGTQSVIPESESTRPASDRQQDQPLIGRVGNTLVVHPSKVYGYPLGGGSRIDFGNANQVAFTHDMVVVRNYGDDGHQLRGFAPDGSARSEWVDGAPNDLWTNSAGHIVTTGGTYSFTGEGFERISAHAIVAVGQNHHVEVRCDAVLACSYFRVPVRPGQVEEVFVSFNEWRTTHRLSPDGNWAGKVLWDSEGNETFVLVDIRTGNETEFERTMNGRSAYNTGAAWDPTSRYSAFGVTGGRVLTIFDTATGASRDIHRDDLGVDVRLAHLVILGTDEI